MMLFGALALVRVGVYGVIAYGGSGQTREWPDVEPPSGRAVVHNGPTP